MRERVPVNKEEIAFVLQTIPNEYEFVEYKDFLNANLRLL